MGAMTRLKMAAMACSASTITFAIFAGEALARSSWGL
jgi:hypothetical protein